MTTELHLEIDPGTHRAGQAARPGGQRRQHRGPVLDVLTSQNDRMFCTVGTDRRLRVWRVDRTEPYRTLLTPRGEGDAGRIEVAARHPKDGWVALALSGPEPVEGRPTTSTVWRYDIEADRVTHFEWPRPIGAMAFDASGGRLLIADRVGLHVLLAASLGEGADLVDLAGSVEHRLEIDRWEPLAMVVAVAGAEGAFRVVVVAGGDDDDAPQAFDFGRDGLTPVAGPSDDDRPADEPAGETRPTNPGDVDHWGGSLSIFWPERVASSVPARLVAVAGRSEVVVTDTDGRPVGRVALPADRPGPVPALAFSPDGSHLLVGLNRGASSALVAYDVSSEGVTEVDSVDFGESIWALGMLDSDGVVAVTGQASSIHRWKPRVIYPTDEEGAEWGELCVEGAAAEIVDIGVADDEVAFGHRQAEAGADQAPLHRTFDLDILDLRGDDPPLVPVDPDELDTDPFGFDGNGDDQDGLDLLDAAGGFDVVDDPSDDAEDEPGQEAAYDAADPETGPTHQRRRHSWDDTHLSADANALLLRRGLAGDPVIVADAPAAFTFVAADRVAVSATDGSLRILQLDADEWWTVDGELRPPSRIVAHDCRAADLAANDRWLALAGDDGVIRLWFVPDLLAEPGTGEDEMLDPALQLFVAADGEWVLWSVDGVYTSSAGGDRYLLHVVDRGDGGRPQAYTSDRFFDQLYRPYLIEAIVAEGSQERACVAVGEDQPKPIIDLELPPLVERLEIEPIDTTVVVASFQLVDQGDHPATLVTVLVNGHVQWELAGDDGLAGPITTDPLVLDGNTPTHQILVVAENAVARSTAAEIELTAEELSKVEAGIVAILPEPATYIEPLTEPLLAGDALPPLSRPTPISVTGAEVRVDLEAMVEHDTELVATRNDETLLSASLAPGVEVRLSVDLAAIDGTNHLQVAAYGADQAETLFDGTFDAEVPPADFDPLTDGASEATTPDWPDAGPPDPHGERELAPFSLPSPPGGAPVDLESPGGSGGAESSGAQDPMLRSVAPTQPDPVHGPLDQARLYIVSVGVSDVLDNRYLSDLKYADDDAIAVAAQLANTGRSDAFGSVRSPWVLTDASATRSGVLAALDELKQEVAAREAAKRSAQKAAEDVVVFFFAGHGLTAKRAVTDQDALFHLVTHDHDDDRVAETGLSLREVGRRLAALPAYVVVMIDACHSGATTPDQWQPSRPNEVAKGLTIDDDGKTTFVITATSGKEVAYEDRLRVPYRRPASNAPKIGHGLFTHGILRTLTESPEGGITPLQLGANVMSYVRQWTTLPAWRRRRRQIQTPRVQVQGRHQYAVLYKPSKSR